MSTLHRQVMIKAKFLVTEDVCEIELKQNKNTDTLVKTGVSVSVILF